jgi:hypothetical protein
VCHAWVSSSSPTRQQLNRLHWSVSATPSGTPSSLYSSTTIGSNADAAADDDDDDDDDDFEYVEYDILTEKEFMGSEWLVGTVMDSRPNYIAETWIRLTTDRDGKNVAVWGDGAKGVWSLDVANQFLSMSKENILGKNIWAGVVDDYYFTLGTVRGWSVITPAEVKGQWQARRLGVDPQEAGTAPWFESTEDDKDEAVAPAAPADQTEAPKLEAKAEEAAPATVSTETAESSKE